MYRLLRPGDIGESLVDKTVYVLWPDDGTWYRGEVTECSVGGGGGGEGEGGDGAAAGSSASATIYYVSTQETEECDLAELVADGQIAFSECRVALRMMLSRSGGPGGLPACLQV